MHLFPPDDSGWYPQVKVCSSLQNDGIQDVWEMILNHKEQLTANGFLNKNRQDQQLTWFQENLQSLLTEHFFSTEGLKEEMSILQTKVASGEVPALNAAHLLVSKFFKK